MSDSERRGLPARIDDSFERMRTETGRIVSILDEFTALFDEELRDVAEGKQEFLTLEEIAMCSAMLDRIALEAVGILPGQRPAVVARIKALRRILNAGAASSRLPKAIAQ